jgi:hypothetical protein
VNIKHLNERVLAKSSASAEMEQSRHEMKRELFSSQAILLNQAYPLIICLFESINVYWRHDVIAGGSRSFLEKSGKFAGIKFDSSFRYGSEQRIWSRYNIKATKTQTKRKPNPSYNSKKLNLENSIMSSSNMNFTSKAEGTLSEAHTLASSYSHIESKFVPPQHAISPLSSC